MAKEMSYRDFFHKAIEKPLWSNPDFLSSFESYGVKLSHVVVYGEHGWEAALPYFQKDILGTAVITQPPLNRYTSPIYADNFDAKYKRSLLRDLLQIINSGFSTIDLCLDPSTTDLLHIEDLGGYTISYKPTYLVKLNGVDLNTIGSKSMRKRLRKAKDYWTVSTGLLAEDSIAVLESPFKRQQINTPYDSSILSRMLAQMQQNGQAVCHQLRNSQGVLGAVSVAVSDQNHSYLLLSGSTDFARQYDGGSYVLANDLIWSQNQGHTQADFLGSALPGPAQNRRSLGGEKSRYLQIRKNKSLKVKLLRKAKHLFT